MVLESFEQNLKCQAPGLHLRLLMQDGKSVRSGDNQCHWDASSGRQECLRQTRKLCVNPVDILLGKRQPSPAAGTREKIG